MKKILLTFLFFGIWNIYAGDLSTSQLDSLYNLFVYGRTFSLTEQPVTSTEYIKCGFGLVSAIHENMNSFSSQQQVELKKLLQRPTTRC